MSTAAVLGPDGFPAKQWLVHEIQRSVLMSEKRIIVWPAGRRLGKSEGAVMWLLRKAQDARLRGKRGIIWVIFPTYDIGRIAWRKIMRLAPSGWITGTHGTEMQPQAIHMGPVTIEFKSAVNPGRLVGEGLLAVWIDEAGIIAERVWEESIRPTMVDHKAPALLTGTPKGLNWFWDVFTRGQDPAFPDYWSICTSATRGVPSYMNPFIPRDEIDDLARDMSAETYQQEILAEFLGDATSVFRKVTDAVTRMGGQFCTEHPTAAMGVDLAKSFDFTVVLGMCSEFHVTYFDRFNELDWALQEARIKTAFWKLGQPWVVIDATSIGDSPTENLMRAGLGIEPFVFTRSTKGPLIEALAVAFDQDIVGLPELPVLINELRAFKPERRENYVSYSAPPGKHDDCVIALALAYRGASRYGVATRSLPWSMEKTSTERAAFGYDVPGVGGDDDGGGDAEAMMRTMGIKARFGY